MVRSFAKMVLPSVTSPISQLFSIIKNMEMKPNLPEPTVPLTQPIPKPHFIFPPSPPSSPIPSAQIMEWANHNETQIQNQSLEIQIEMRTEDLDLRKPRAKRSLGVIDEGRKRYCITTSEDMHAALAGLSIIPV